MVKKRKRLYDDHYDDRSGLNSSFHDLTQPDVEGAHLYTQQHQLPWDIQNYWRHRHDLFDLYDHGIWTTDDSWFEVTPEKVANMIAQHVDASKPKDRIIMLDCFAGIGGNAIAFALAGYKRVYAIEKNLAALECARHNAKIYGVHNQITFFHGDCFEILGLSDGQPGKKIDDLVAVIKKAGIIFASPPWGGKLTSILITSRANLCRTKLQRRSHHGPQYYAIRLGLHVLQVLPSHEKRGVISAEDI